MTKPPLDPLLPAWQAVGQEKGGENFRHWEKYNEEAPKGFPWNNPIIAIELDCDCPPDCSRAGKP